MRNERGGDSTPRRPKFRNLLQSDPNIFSPIASNNDGDDGDGDSVASAAYYDGAPLSAEASPCVLSPWNNFSSPAATASPYTKSPWIVKASPLNPFDENNLPRNGLIGSIMREEGHIYSLATTGNLLYTGSDSKNIRVWKNLNEFSGFKSGSGLIKAIVISGDRIFTGHQDGKIRIWRVSSRSPAVYRRIGHLPTTKDSFRSSMNPKNYVEVRRHRSVLRIRHYDAVSCLSLCPGDGLLYSGSWDKTVKVWRVSDSKCLESIAAHDDAVNAVAAAFDGLVLTGSADGTVKVWRREPQGKGFRHFQMQLLLKQENAITALAVDLPDGAVYCGSSDGLVNFWLKEKQRLAHGGVLRGHKLAVLCLAAAGKLVFSGSADKTICVWRRDGGGIHTCLSVLAGHDGPVKCLAVEEDRETAADSEERRWTVYSGSLDKSVKVWSVGEAAVELPPVKGYALDGYAPPTPPRFGQQMRCY